MRTGRNRDEEIEFWNVVDPEPEGCDPDEWRAMIVDIADNLNCDPHDVASDLFAADPGWRLRRMGRKMKALLQPEGD
jgi:hypothetical protein